MSCQPGELMRTRWIRYWDSLRCISCVRPRPDPREHRSKEEPCHDQPDEKGHNSSEGSLVSKVGGDETEDGEEDEEEDVDRMARSTDFEVLGCEANGFIEISLIDIGKDVTKRSPPHR